MTFAFPIFSTESGRLGAVAAYDAKWMATRRGALAYALAAVKERPILV
jgi:hypothetical protein